MNTLRRMLTLSSTLRRFTSLDVHLAPSPPLEQLTHTDPAAVCRALPSFWRGFTASSRQHQSDSTASSTSPCPAPELPSRQPPQEAPSPSGKLALVFTCTVCDTRTAKTFSKLAYEQGVVLIRCPGCGGQHLIADNLGWFEEGGTTVEDIVRARGEEVRTKVLDGSVDITLDDVVGWSTPPPPPASAV